MPAARRMGVSDGRRESRSQSSVEDQASGPYLNMVYRAVGRRTLRICWKARKDQGRQALRRICQRGAGIQSR